MDITARTPLGHTALALAQALAQLVHSLGKERRAGVEGRHANVSFHTRKRRTDSSLFHLDTSGAHLSAHGRLALAHAKKATRAAFDAFHLAWTHHPALECCTWNTLGWPSDRSSLGMMLEPQMQGHPKVWLHTGTLPYGEDNTAMDLAEAVDALDRAWDAAQATPPNGEVAHQALEDLSAHVWGNDPYPNSAWKGPCMGARAIWQALAPFWSEPGWEGKRHTRVWSQAAPITLRRDTTKPDVGAVALNARWNMLCKTLRAHKIANAIFVVGNDGKALLHIGSADHTVQGMARSFLEDLVAWRPALAPSAVVRCTYGVGTLGVFGGKVAEPSNLMGVAGLTCEGPLWMVSHPAKRGTCWMKAPFATQGMAEQAARMLDPDGAHPTDSHVLWTAP